MKIGELARQTGVSVDTLRFWDKEGLLHPERGSNGYRQYGPQAVRQLGFILAMKELGFGLDAIKELLSIRVEKDGHSCAEVKALTQAHLAQVEARLAQLSRVRDALSDMVDACCGGDELAVHCSILDALEAS